MALKPQHCAYKPCSDLFTPTKEGQRFCTTPGKNCRQKWHQTFHQESTLPGTVKGLRQLKNRDWSITIHYPVQPRVNIGASVALETTPGPRLDASQRDNSK